MQDIVNLLQRLSPQTPELRFLTAAAAVVLAGTRLSKYGDIFSEKLKLGQAFVGLIFMSFATALPEFFTSTSAVVIEKSPNMALGNNLGSIFFNISILGWLDLVMRRKSLYGEVSSTVMVPGAVSLVMIALSAFFLSIEMMRPGFSPVLFGMGAGSFVIFAAYAAGALFLHRFHQEHPAGDDEKQTHKDVSLGWTFAKYLAAAAVIAWAGVNLAKSGDELSVKYALSKSFVGSIFLAIATSLPEVTATITMVRHGFYEMAFGNIFGSNAFNVVILATVDLFHRGGYLFAGAATEGSTDGLTTDASHIHLVTTSLSVLMTAIVVMGVMRKPGKMKLWMSWPSALLFVTFIIGAWVMYALGAR